MYLYWNSSIFIYIKHSHLSPYCYPYVIEHIASGDLKTDGVVTRYFDLENWQEAFEYATGKYGDFKVAVGEVTADALAPVQQRFADLMADKAGLEAQMKKGAEEASYYARRTLSKIQKKLGFVQIR